MPMLGVHKAMYSEQFSVACFVLNRYASTKPSTPNFRVMAALGNKYGNGNIGNLVFYNSIDISDQCGFVV
jgi:hypothetical protein